MKRPEPTYSCVIIDDDVDGIQLLEEYASAIPNLLLNATFSDPAGAIREIKKGRKIDFLFLDIDMDISGLDIARILRDDVCFIVFVTGHPEHALEAFSVNADRYLLKPVSLQKFKKTVIELQSRHTPLNA